MWALCVVHIYVRTAAVPKCILVTLEVGKYALTVNAVKQRFTGKVGCFESTSSYSRVPIGRSLELSTLL